jgi:hypothetical protein
MGIALNLKRVLAGNLRYLLDKLFKICWIILEE